MTVVHDDLLLTVETDVPVPFGTSMMQKLNNGIIFTIRSPFARMIQFKCRRYIWDEGPEDGKETIIDFKNTSDLLDYQVDAVGKLNPYYDSWGDEKGGASKRENGLTIIADQPDVSIQETVMYEEGKRLEDMKSYGIINEFRALSFIISNNKVIRTVQWYRTGEKGVSKYHDIVVTTAFTKIPAEFLQIIRNGGYSVPHLQSA